MSENIDLAMSKQNTVSVFMQGAYKGMMMAIKNMFPAVMFAYVLIVIWEGTGLLNIIA